MLYNLGLSCFQLTLRKHICFMLIIFHKDFSTEIEIMTPTMQIIKLLIYSLVQKFTPLRVAPLSVHPVARCEKAGKTSCHQSAVLVLSVD